MKTSKFTFALTCFLIGAGFGISVLGLISFKNANGPGSPPQKYTPIPTDQAHALVGYYIAASKPVNLVVQAISIDTAQLAVMNAIMDTSHTITGFRVYLGLENGKNRLGIVVPFDVKGVEKTAFAIPTKATLAGPCPIVCDKGSPIYNAQ